MKRFSAVVFVMAGTALAGCSKPDPTGSAPSTSLAASPGHSSDATDVIDAFKKAGLPVGDVLVLTDATDDNQLLGRPGQYTSKLFFYDGRHPKVADTDDNENTIEAFSSAVEAKARRDYIAQMTQGVGVLTQYQLLRANVLVRFHKALLPAEVEAYKRVLEATISE